MATRPSCCVRSVHSSRSGGGGGGAEAAAAEFSPPPSRIAAASANSTNGAGDGGGAASKSSGPLDWCPRSEPCRASPWAEVVADPLVPVGAGGRPSPSAVLSQPAVALRRSAPPQPGRERGEPRSQKRQSAAWRSRQQQIRKRSRRTTRAAGTHMSCASSAGPSSSASERNRPPGFSSSSLGVPAPRCAGRRRVGPGRALVGWGRQHNCGSLPSDSAPRAPRLPAPISARAPSLMMATRVQSAMVCRRCAMMSSIDSGKLERTVSCTRASVAESTDAVASSCARGKGKEG